MPRQFLGRMNKPEVDFIKGLPPAIAIEQRVNTRNPRSTVGTSTEIYDYLKFLYARIGKTYSPVSGDLVKKETVTDVVDYIVSFPEGSRLLLMCPLKNNRNLSFAQKLEDLKHQGITRLDINGEMLKLEEAIVKYSPTQDDAVNIVIDRIVVARMKIQKAVMPILPKWPSDQVKEIAWLKKWMITTPCPILQ